MSETGDYASPSTDILIIRQPAVSWFNINQLLATAAKTLSAGIVGPMSGRRELMAALDPPNKNKSGYLDWSHKDELWVDYMADTGDGWNATTSVAWLIGRDALILDRDGKATPQPIPASQEEGPFTATEDEVLLPRGELLIAGGDEVYPTASADDYQRRLVLPYSCARFSQTPARAIVAVPGNHDWYDGLTAFIRLFCQRWDARRWIGAWRTQQWRSYFAVKLPHGWWLWGIDAALADDLDPPQLDYFRDAASHLEAGDKVVLCIPAPHWPMGRPEATKARHIDDKLGIFQDLAATNGAAGIKMILTGDLHYYAHYRSIDPDTGKMPDNPNHYVICGGGGAFGLGTILAPSGPVAVGGECAEPVPGGLFPTRSQSVTLRRGIRSFPLRNPGFVGLLVGVQMIALWLISALPPTAERRGSWISYAMDLPFSFGGVLAFLLQVLKALPHPALLLCTLAVFAGFIVFALSGRTEHGSKGAAGFAGGLHAFLQISGSVSLLWLSAQFIGAVVPARTGQGWLDLFAILLSVPAQFAWCGFLFGAYLFLGHKVLKLHDLEVFSAQGIEDYKGFLKLRVDAGGITVFPIGLRRAARRWKAAPGVEIVSGGKSKGGDELGRETAVRTPVGCQRVVDPVEPLAPHFIEQPFTVSGRSRA